MLITHGIFCNRTHISSVIFSTNSLLFLVAFSRYTVLLKPIVFHRLVSCNPLSGQVVRFRDV
jgi:hypothetical protein